MKVVYGYVYSIKNTILFDLGKSHYSHLSTLGQDSGSGSPPFVLIKSFHNFQSYSIFHYSLILDNLHPCMELK